MTPESWFASHTFDATTWSGAEIQAWKADTCSRISVVIPARNEEATVGPIVAAVREQLMEQSSLVDELFVIDSDSDDRTADVARAAGATVLASAEIRPDLGSFPGKGEALWKSLFVTAGDIIVFLDADVTTFTARYVSGLIAPLLAHPDIVMVKGFYDRDLLASEGAGASQGGRVTELTARPVLNLWWPQLAGVVQPLAGEWAIRRDLAEQLQIPTGYGVELATLVDTYARRGLAGIAQVDLGRRDHRHQDLASLSAMSTEVLAAATARRSQTAPAADVEAARFRRGSAAAGGRWEWESVGVATIERPAAATVPPEPSSNREALTGHAT